MKQAIMKRWVKALRSRKYKQGRGCLRGRNNHNVATNNFCCLGVLCDLFAKEHSGAGWVSKADEARTNLQRSRCTFVEEKTDICATSDTDLPLRVRQWAGIKTASGHFDVTKEFSDILSPATPGLGPTRANLAELNDSCRLDFSQIADVVEKHWRKL